MSDQSREEFEKWLKVQNPVPHIAGKVDGRYCRPWVEDYWHGWQAAWKASSPLVARDGWLTDEEIDSIARHPSQVWEAELGVLADMARAAIGLHAQHAALLEKLRAAIETIERGNV